MAFATGLLGEPKAGEISASAPGNLQVKAVGDNQVGISWDRPFALGTNFTGYHVAVDVNVTGLAVPEACNESLYQEGSPLPLDSVQESWMERILGALIHSHIVSHLSAEGCGRMRFRISNESQTSVILDDVIKGARISGVPPSLAFLRPAPHLYTRDPLPQTLHEHQPHSPAQ